MSIVFLLSTAGICLILLRDLLPGDCIPVVPDGKAFEGTWAIFASMCQTHIISRAPLAILVSKYELPSVLMSKRGSMQVGEACTARSASTPIPWLREAWK